MFFLTRKKKDGIKRLVLIVYILNLLSIYSFASTAIKLGMGDILKTDTNSIRLPIKIDNQEQIRGLQFDLSFNRNMLSLKNVGIGSMASSFSELHKITDTYFRVILYNFSGSTLQQGSGTILNIDFDILDTVRSEGLASFSFEKVIAPGLDGGNQIESSGVSGTTFALSKNNFPELFVTATPMPTAKYTGNPSPTIKPTATIRPTDTPRAIYIQGLRVSPSPRRNPTLINPTPSAVAEAWELQSPSINSFNSQSEVKVQSETQSLVRSKPSSTPSIARLNEFEVNTSSQSKDVPNSGMEKYAPFKGDVGILLYGDKLKYGEASRINYSIRYINKGEKALQNLKIQSIIPENTKLVLRNSGNLVDGFIEWTLPLLEAKESGEVSYSVSVLQLPQEEVKVINEVKILSMDPSINIINKEDDNSKLLVLCFKKDGVRKHKSFVNGFPDGTFRPEKLISRAEYATLIATILEDLGKEFALNTDNEFRDVPKSHWAYPFVKLVARKGIFMGGLDGNFSPDASLTRGELSVIATKLMGSTTQYFEKDSFLDSGSHWARTFIEEAYRNQIVSGYADKSFLPNKAVTRAEAVTILDRMLFRGPLKAQKSIFKDIDSSHWAYGYIQEASRDHSYCMEDDGGEEEK